jgi:uncharacterized protein DUF3187
MKTAERRMEAGIGGDVLAAVNQGGAWMARRLVAVLSFLAILGTGGAARGVEIHPFYAGHFSPLAQTFGIPPAEDGEIAARGTVLARLVLDVANSFQGGAGPRQSAGIDGETLRTTLAFRYGFTPRFEGGVDIPFVHHSGGVLDGFIESFHRWIGKPKNDGAGDPRDQLNYNYRQDGVTKVNLRDDATAFGDMALSASWRLSSATDEGRSVAVRATLNIPTGKESALAGSGGTGGSLRLALRDAKALGPWNVTVFAAGGALYIGKDTFLGDLRQPLVGFGTVGAGWAPASWVAIKFQAGGHTALSREREFKPLSWTINVMGGFTFALPEGVDMDLGVFETVLNETGPDVGFQLGFRKRFGG